MSIRSEDTMIIVKDKLIKPWRRKLQKRTKDEEDEIADEGDGDEENKLK